MHLTIISTEENEVPENAWVHSLSRALRMAGFQGLILLRARLQWCCKAPKKMGPSPAGTGNTFNYWWSETKSSALSAKNRLRMKGRALLASL
jgi:hypothetical protein